MQGFEHVKGYAGSDAANMSDSDPTLWPGSSQYISQQRCCNFPKLSIKSAVSESTCLNTHEFNSIAKQKSKTT